MKLSKDTKKRQLLATLTSEPFQPVRLYYSIPDRSFVIKKLQSLKCMIEVPHEQCWQWLFEAEGAWEYDPMSGSGRVTLGKDGRLRGVIKIKDGDSSTFIAVRSTEPDEPIQDPPSYRDKWRRRW
jgi:hypothetical protein